MKQSFSVIEQVLKSIREFFSSRGFHEVVVPVFNSSLPLEPNIYAFKIGDYYLPTSPEATLKKMIARGIGNCFAIGHTFRDLERGSPIHKPEFLMLEWYRENADYRKIMKDCRELIIFIYSSSRAKSRDPSTSLKNNLHSREIPPRASLGRDDIEVEWKLFSMVELFEKYAKLDLSEIIDDREMLKVATKRGYNTQNATWESLFNQIFLNEIEKHLATGPLFVIDYPAKISPLCAKRRDKPYLAQRFELYINGIEIANGNTENTEATEVLKAMKEEEINRQRNGLICPPIDMEFIEALKKMPGKSYAGIGLGIERLTMVLGGIEDINKLT